MKRSISTTLSGLCLLFFAYGSSSQAADFNSLNIMTEEFNPYNYTENGELTGKAVDLLIAASSAVGKPIAKEKITVAAWARAYKTALSGPNVLLFSTTRTEERESLFKWAGPLGGNRTVVWAKKSSNIEKFDDVSQTKEKIVVIRDDVGEQLVLSAGTPEGMVTQISKSENAAKMLISGRAKLWGYDEGSALTILEGLGENLADYEVVNVVKATELYFAFSTDVDDSIVQLLQKGIDEVR